MGVGGGPAGPSPPRDKSPGAAPLPGSRGVVRAELVVVQGESSDSDGNDGDDSVFEEVAAVPQSPRAATATAVAHSVSADHLGRGPAPTAAREEGKESRPSPVEVAIRRASAEEEEEEKKKVAEELRGEALRRREEEEEREGEGEQEEEVAEEEEEEEEEGGEEEAEQEEEQGGRRGGEGRVSPAVYGIENAAFDDDRDVDRVLREDPQEEEEEGEEDYREDGPPGEYEDYYEEAPGLSDEEEPPLRRKIQFSTDPILVSGRVLFVCGFGVITAS